MKRYWHPYLETIISLEWYELALTVLFSFVAKTSEVLVAAGLVMSTANFLTDGTIMTAHPGLATAWAWAQSISLDSSLAVCLAYTFQCLNYDAWIKGVLYGALTVLLSVVAGTITTIDIVSHALHISTGSAMQQMGINVTLLSQLRAVAVVGFILISRLRTLPLKALTTHMGSAPQPANPLAKGGAQGTRIQTVVQSLCSQFSPEEVAEIINACITAKKITLARWSTQAVSVAPEPQAAPEPQSNDQTKMAQQNGAAPEQEDARVSARIAQEPPRTAEPPDKEPQAEVERRPRDDPEPGPAPQAPALQKLVPETQRHSVPHDEPHSAPKPEPEPSDGPPVPAEPAETVPSEETPVQREERLEQAYQSLLAEGKKPSGRALAERAHIHRTTCVAWLRAHHQGEPAQEESEQEASAPDQFQEQPLPEPVEEHVEEHQEDLQP